MVATNSPKRTSEKPAVCILYGFCEGPHMAAPFLRPLAERGFRVVRDPQAADVVIAHSGGCFLVSDDLPARKIVMIGLTHWPGKSILRALIEKNWNDLRLHRGDRNLRTWAHKFAWNMMYFWNMRNNLRMLSGRKCGDFWHARHITLVRNREDSFCTPNVAHMPFEHKPEFVEVPGQHDDIWLHPQRYVAIIESDAPWILAQTGN